MGLAFCTHRFRGAEPPSPWPQRSLGADDRSSGQSATAEAEATDRAEDAKDGEDKRGDELPEELARRESRIAKLGAAEKGIEDEAQEAGPVDCSQRGGYGSGGRRELLANGSFTCSATT